MRTSSRLAVLALVLAGVIACTDKTTPTQPSMTPAPGPGSTPTPAPGPGSTPTVMVGGGANAFTDQQSGSSTTTIRAGQTVTWSWAGGTHSTTSGNCCSANGVWDSGIKSSGTFSHMFSTAGSFPYYCQVHGAMMTGMVVVNP